MTRRARPRKVGLKRIDAAIDALLPLGFSKELICKTVDKLLKVYEGDSGWVFIEEASYRLVIETILEEQEKSSAQQDSCKHGFDSLDVAALTDEVASIEGTNADPMIVGHMTERGESPAPGAVSTSEDASVRQITMTSDLLAAGAVSTSEDASVRQETRTCLQEDLDWEDISCNSKKLLGNEHRTSPSSSDPVEGISCCRRRPCYGWISDNDSEGEDAKVYKFPQVSSIRKMGDFDQGKKRKSLWDVTPDKMDSGCSSSFQFPALELAAS